MGPVKAFRNADLGLDINGALVLLVIAPTSGFGAFTGTTVHFVFVALAKPGMRGTRGISGHQGPKSSCQSLRG